VSVGLRRLRLPIVGWGRTKCKQWYECYSERHAASSGCVFIIRRIYKQRTLCIESGEQSSRKM